MVLALDNHAVVVTMMSVNEKSKQLHGVVSTISTKLCYAHMLTNVMKKNMQFMMPSAKQALSIAQFLFRLAAQGLSLVRPKYPKGPRLT